MSKIWIFNFTDPPPQYSSNHKRRHESLAYELLHLGNDVHWILDSFSHAHKAHFKLPTKESNIEIDTTLVRSIGYKKNISLRRIIHNYFLSISSVYIFFKKMISEGRPNKVLVSFPPIEVSFALVLICKLFGISIVLDYRDLHPDIFPMTARSKISKSIISLFIFPYTLMVRWSLRNASKVFTTSPGTSNYLFNKYRLKIVPSSYYHYFQSELLETSDTKLNPIKDTIINYKKDFSNSRIFSYCGTLSRRLDLLNFIEVFKDIDDKSNILFICGSGDMFNILKQASKGQKNIFVKEQISREDVSDIYKISDFGILPYPADLDFQLAPPTKLAEILYHNLSIISSESTYVQKYFSKKINAKFYKFDNYTSLFSVIDKMSHDKFVNKNANHNLYNQHFNIDQLETMVEEILK